ncbi:MAG TPA: Xaa-Pro peptidase family protein [Terriglobales bacterium]|nr:Xaa-Pro peptidase family protein [Terriglobales bacterium]
MRKRLVLISFLIMLASLAQALERQPASDYHARREKLAAKLEGGVALVFAPPEPEGPNDVYGYRPDNNFYYLTGWTEPGAALLVAAAVEGKEDGARPYTEILFLPKRNYSQERWTGPKLGPEDPKAAQLVGADKVEPLDDLRDALVKLPHGREMKIYTDIPAGEDDSNSTAPLRWLRNANSFAVGTSFHDIRPLLSSLRMVKDAGEIELIRKATNASIAAHLAVIRTIKPGVTEREIAALFEYEWGKRGCERPSYAPIVGSGFNSTVLHYSDDSGTMQSGDVVVMDAAGEYSLYATDITRTVPVNGKFSPRQREIYEIVLGAQKAAMAAFQSGKSTLRRNKPNSLNDVASEYINTHGKDLHGEPLGKYFIHGLGHYVGLAVHDEGDYDVPLGPGVVFTIEPGIYIPEEKIGVRIEDMYYVDKDGKLIRLTESLPQAPDEIERLMTAAGQ